MVEDGEPGKYWSQESIFDPFDYVYVERESKRDRFPNLSPRKRKDISIGKKKDKFLPTYLFLLKKFSVNFFSYVEKKQFFWAQRS